MPLYFAPLKPRLSFTADVAHDTQPPETAGLSDARFPFPRAARDVVKYRTSQRVRYFYDVTGSHEILLSGVTLVGFHCVKLTP